MIIQNRSALATSRLRSQALDILEAGIERVLPDRIMQSVQYDRVRRILRVDNDQYPLGQGRLFVIGAGKASARMAAKLEGLVGPANITAGVVICKHAPFKLERIELVEAGHPVPDERGVRGMQKFLALKRAYSINENDLVFCLISGGGSALMPAPLEGLSLADEGTVTGLLLGSGADINQINVVRKHLSRVKGGRLAAYFAPATVISLVLSDVIGNDLGTIASGPTFPDSSTFADALAVLSKYNLTDKVPAKVLAVLEKGKAGQVEESPKTLANAHNYLIGDNTLALAAMAEKAAKLGLRPLIVTAEQKGDTTVAAQKRAEEILHNVASKYDTFLIGGETTPTLPAACGRGGRNQHYAAASVLALADYPGVWVVASVGTDGSDFLPGVAGAIVDDKTLHRLEERNVAVRDYLDRCDSNTLLSKLDDALIVTGDTGTNVGDLVVYVVRREGAESSRAGDS